ncbi:MAG: carboxypeptidase regulatory-like domain-containing protein [bacterium]|nr:carboxypeptidase regulatory-like domain-containing protein [bacterium]
MRSRFLGVGLGLILSLAVTPSFAAYKGGAVSGGGSISGKILYGGAPVSPKKLSANKDKAVCAKSPIFSEALVIKGGGLQWAVVSIKGIKSGKEFPKSMANAEVDQAGCVYLPHVAVMQAGSQIVIKNSDGILHNVHTYPGKTGNKTANLAQPKFKKKLKMKKTYFSKPGIVSVKCDVHDWMSGFIVAADHPYYAVTGPDGSFKLDGVPAGSYTVEVWHETLGTQTMKVTVKGGADAKAELTLK